MSKRQGLETRGKVRLKRTLLKMRHTYGRLLRPFDPGSLSRALAAVGIETGDVLFVHVAYNQFAGFTGGPGDVIHVLQQAVGGESGTLLMPTLPFDGIVLDYVAKKQVTDLKRTPSAMGIVSEIFRRMPGVVRTIHPTHPVAVWGANAEALARDHHEASTPCGESSPYMRLPAFKGKILFLGASITTMTFYHAVEEVIEPLLPFSPFTKENFELETRDRDGRIWTTRTRLFDPAISRRRDVRILEPVLKQQGQWRETRAGLLRVVLLQAHAVMETCTQLARQGRHCYGK